MVTFLSIETSASVGRGEGGRRREERGGGKEGRGKEEEGRRRKGKGEGGNKATRTFRASGLGAAGSLVTTVFEERLLFLRQLFGRRGVGLV